jgi:8-oxo-dGTP diphosphatase
MTPPDVTRTDDPISLADVMAPAWRAQQRATLLFIIRDAMMLLIHKKRGLGAGKINGPGGRIEPGETSEQAAVREVQEELCVTPLGVSHCGRLRFQFLDGLSLDVTVFRAADCRDEPQETGEAIPLWVPLDAIPYDRMWPDDEFWIPLMLAGKTFEGAFLFDGDDLLDHVITVIRE